MEINFFDTPLNIILKQYYIEAKIYLNIFIVSKCGEHGAETGAGENSKKEKLREHTSEGTAIVATATVKERKARKRKVRVVSLFPIKLNIYII